MPDTPEQITLTTLLPRAHLFQTGSLAVPVSRFLCEHLPGELMALFGVTLLVILNVFTT